MGVASAGSERRIDETASLMLPFALGCHHGQLSRPSTIEKRMYQVYLACGQERGKVRRP